MTRTHSFMLALCLTLVTSQAQAQKTAATTAPAPEGYREALVSALQKVKAGQWPEAMALFERAHRLYPNARTLRGLAIVSYADRRYVDTLSYGRASLENQERALTKKQRDHVEGLLKEALTFVGRLKVTTTPADAELLVDGNPAQLQEGELLVDPGGHELVARAPDHAELVRTVALKAGQTQQLSLQLTPTRTNLLAPATDSPAPLQAEQQGGSSPRRVWTWVAAGAAVAFGGLAVGSYVAANGERDKVAAACAAMPAMGCTDDAERDALLDATSVGTFEALATTGLVLSLTSVAAAGVLFWWEGRASAPQEEAQVRWNLTPTGVQMRGSF